MAPRWLQAFTSAQCGIIVGHQHQRDAHMLADFLEVIKITDCAKPHKAIGSGSLIGLDPRMVSWY